MSYKINYADTIFFLNQCIKHLQQGFNLEIDADFFRDKMLEDILFIDAGLARLYSGLRSNNYLISRQEHLRDLQRAMILFIDFIDSIIDHKCSFAPHLAHARVKLKACRLEQEKNRSDISMILTGTSIEDECEDTVSQDEFRFLLEQDYQDDDQE
ncbi:MAG: hypothetical protein D6B26_05870 [Spirochaetaceae bacterium]|nr:MAG: hypothetical protein D6B26_05870 [Spirochaetaceae bacterium]